MIIFRTDSGRVDPAVCGVLGVLLGDILLINSLLHPGDNWQIDPDYILHNIGLHIILSLAWYTAERVKYFGSHPPILRTFNHLPGANENSNHL